MIHIVKATPADATAIQKLLKETWKDTYEDHLSQATLDEVYQKWQSIEFLTKQIENNAMHFPIAKEGDEVVGIATAHQPEDTILLFRLYVAPSYQRKGIGSKLIKDVLEYFSTAEKIDLYVEALNEKGKSFYKKHGFQELRREQEKIVNEVIEQVLMRKELLPHSFNHD